MTDERIDELLEFWFVAAGAGRWFAADPAFDGEVRARFGDLAAEAIAGRLERWRDTARGSLALCLLLDQFPRNLWRGLPQAFAADEMARDVAAAALAAGFDQDLPAEQRLFLYLPFEHSERLADQDRSVALTAGLGNAEWSEHAERHRAIIRRFGRFPHRNEALGRISTPEEQAFLREPGSRF